MEQLQNTRPLTTSLNLLLPWSAVRSRLASQWSATVVRSRWISNKQSVKLKSYSGPLFSQSSVKLKCYRSPQFGSGWKNEVYSCFFYAYRLLSVKLKCYRGPQSRSGWKNEVYSWLLYTVIMLIIWRLWDCGSSIWKHIYLFLLLLNLMTSACLFVVQGKLFRKNGWLPVVFFLDSQSPCPDLLFPYGPNLAKRPMYCRHRSKPLF